MRTRSHGTRSDHKMADATGTSVEPHGQSSRRTILVVADQDECRITTKWFLANFGYAVVTARSAVEALTMFVPEIHDVVVTDNAMAGLTGVEMAHIIKLRSPETPVIMYSDQPPSDQSCLDIIIQRPTHLLRLKQAIDAALVGSRSSDTSE